MSKTELATFGGGCFWCTEAVFSSLKGVVTVTSGYAGGTAETANYTDVCMKKTDHAEVVQIEFDPDIIPFEILLKVHLTTHDPTTLNRQGADTGTQYRSVVFFHDEAQKSLAKDVIAEIESGLDQSIVTTLEPYEAFYRAEDNHQNFYADNVLNPYCQAVIVPKLSKFRSHWKDWLA